MDEPRHEKTGFFCICENKDADQLRGNREADQRLCFRYVDSTMSLLSKFEISSIEPSPVAAQPSLCRGNPEDRFSHNEAHYELRRVDEYGETQSPVCPISCKTQTLDTKPPVIFFLFLLNTWIVGAR